MNNSSDFSDDFICDVVKKNRHFLLNEKFEDQVMLKIHAEKKYKSDVLSQLRKSLQFFVGALCLGFGLAVIIVFGDVYSISHTKIVEVLALFFIVVAGILNIENYYRLIGKYVT